MAEQNGAYWVEKLQLEVHPEGGYFRETFRSESLTQLLDGGTRNLKTSIYFLLNKEQKSHFHWLDSDELWHFHAGGSLLVYIIEDGKLRTERLGLDLEEGDLPQILLPKRSIFAAELVDKSSYCLMGCTVSPGFDFEDFHLSTQKELLDLYPEHVDMIERFTLS
ncbi:MAG: putative cupin superfamily sugar epimerase [Marinoscillum sp.]|jgi:predicted cupin superfamily sugar epimerase